MDEDEEKLNKLIKSMKQKDDPSFWEIAQSLWHVNVLIMKKQNELNALRWVAFQAKIDRFISGLFRKK